MFVDKVTINAKAGNGGNGLVSFRRERHIARGGPNGGDGGDGGDVVLVANERQNTLAKFRYNKLLEAQNGGHGGTSNRHGRSGRDLRVEVPVGTVVTNQDGSLIADLVAEGDEIIVAKGGKGGYGNAHFTSSTRQAPRVAEIGEQGEQPQLILELKMIADIGLIGLPNAGKSSFLSAVSNARPEIADYPFTTLRPHLGVADIPGRSILIADIPGLIKGASKGKGLGDDFLKHVSRCQILLHLIDINNYDLARDYKIIRAELEAYSKQLTEKPEIVALTKCDITTKEDIANKIISFKKALSKDIKLHIISAYANIGLEELLLDLAKNVNKLLDSGQKLSSMAEELPVIKLADNQDDWRVEKNSAGFLVTGDKIERFAKKTDFNNPAAVDRLKDIMHKLGISKELERLKIKPKDKVFFGTVNSGYIEN